MSNDNEADHRHRLMLQQWLLLILRFAITRDEPDCTAVLEQAMALDATGGSDGSAFCYFSKASQALCDAIRHSDPEAAKARLRQHACHIDNPRLRQAFLGSVGLHEQPLPQRIQTKQKPLRSASLWRGLR